MKQNFMSHPYREVECLHTAGLKSPWQGYCNCTFGPNDFHFHLRWLCEFSCVDKDQMSEILRYDRDLHHRLFCAHNFVKLLSCYCSVDLYMCFLKKMSNRSRLNEWFCSKE